jgi:hypothetical protein
VSELPIILEEYPTVFCDKCGEDLLYVEREGAYTLRHATSGRCERDGQLFEIRTAELKRIE